MTAPQIQVSGGAILAVAGVAVLGYLVYRGSNALGDAMSSVSDYVSSASDTVIHTVYPDSLLAPGETLSGKLDQRYNTPGDDRSWITKAWDGYWQDVGNFWRGTPEPETWGREVRTPAYTGGASGSW